MKNKIELEKEIVSVVRNSLRDAIKETLVSTYNSPLKELIKEVVNEQSGLIKEVMNATFIGVFKDAEFKEAFRDQLLKKLASILISKLGGEMEKRVNDLRANPETRARITLGITTLIDQILSGANDEE